jgi:hypothetical protein
MKKRELSPIELKKVVELRQLGAKWTEIQQETKVERRAARRAYEEWQTDKKMRDQESVRFRVAAEAFHEHMNDLIRLAGSLMTNLSVPFALADMERNAEQFFSWLWQQDLLQRYISPEIEVDVYTMGERQAFHIGDPQVYRREKELLLDSLKVHTREQVRWEDVLDDRWGRARDKCAKIIPELRKETSEVVKNLVSQEQEANFLQRIKQAGREDDPVERIAEAVLDEIWRAIRQGELGNEGPWFQMVLGHMGSPQDIDVRVKSRARDGTVVTFIGIANENLGDNVTRICNSAYDDLRVRDVAQDLHRQVREMEKASDELREMLNPVKLRPMILRTRCDLCPV